MSMMTGSRPRAGIRQLQRHLLPGGGGHDPLGQPLAHARGKMSVSPAAWSCRSGPEPAPRGAPSTAPAAAWTPWSWSVNKPASWVGPEMTPWGQQRVAAAEREPVLPRRGQCERGDLPVQVTDRHHTIPDDAARSCGWCSLQGLPHALGRCSSGHTAISVSRSRCRLRPPGGWRPAARSGTAGPYRDCTLSVQISTVAAVRQGENLF
jgi:hypothetical protein